jgi:ribosomal protein S18 acetylase RimI-like enzyme
LDYNEINYERFTIYSNGIKKLLIDSYRLSFNISEAAAEEITNQKVESLNQYIINNNAILIVATDRDILAGFTWLHEHDYFGEKRMHINHVVVAEDFRGRGIAERLMLEAEKKSIELGITKIDLYVSESNRAAVNLYNKTGYITERRYLSKELKEMN